MSLRQSRQSPLSTRRMLELKDENSRQERELEKELSRLEKERLLKIRELRQEMQTFRISSARSRSRSRSRSPPKSPSWRATSPFPPSPSLSPRQQLDCSLSTNASAKPIANVNGRPKSGRDYVMESGQDNPYCRGGEADAVRLPALSATSGRTSPYPRATSPLISVSDYATSSSSQDQHTTGRRTSSSNPYARTISLDSYSCDSGPPTPASLSPKASPSTSPRTSPSRMLSRRTPEQQGVRRAASPCSPVTSTTIAVFHHEKTGIRPGPRVSLFDDIQPNPSKERRNSSSSSAIPQIVISSHVQSPTPPNPWPPDTGLVKRDSVDSASCTSSEENLAVAARPLGPRLTADQNSSSIVGTESLAIPASRCRSRSVPSIPAPYTSYLRAIAKKESSFETADITADLSVPGENTQPQRRGRSSSICVPYFSHLKDAPRRDSLLNKYTARRGSFRRTSCTIERLIADLARGVSHAELIDDHAHRKNNISAEEWERLRKCRYLRMPSRSESAESQELDIDEIFS